MARLPGVDDLFEGRHFDREIICLVREVVILRFKLSFRDLVEDGRARAIDGPHHHHALGTSLCS